MTGGAMMDADERIAAAALAALRAAGEPVREAVLYERLREEGVDLTPERLLAVLGRLATEGHLHVAVEHGLPARDPEPFEPRFWRVVE